MLLIYLKNSKSILIYIMKSILKVWCNHFKRYNIVRITYISLQIKKKDKIVKEAIEIVS